jgi:hypothetical protein
MAKNICLNPICYCNCSKTLVGKDEVVILLSWHENILAGFFLIPVENVASVGCCG